MRNVSVKKKNEKAKHKPYVQYFRVFFNEVMWRNVSPRRAQMSIRRMRVACWIPKASNINSQYVMLIAFTL